MRDSLCACCLLFGLGISSAFCLRTSSALPRLLQTDSSQPQAVGNQQSSTPISISSNLVDLPVSVTDRRGNFVDGLNKDNFHVYENGREQRISIFGRQDLPVAVGLVVDHSGSMGPKLAEISAAAEEFAKSSNPADHLFVVNFNEMVSMMLPASVPFTSSEAELRAALANGNAVGQTALYDAVTDALDHLKMSPLKRQALIVVTDGGDNASRHTLDQLLDLAMRSEAQIFCIGIYDAQDPDAKPSVLRRLARITGGEAYFPESVMQVADLTHKIAVNLRKQYDLGFTPEDRAQGWRSVRVVASNGGKLHVHSRMGYLFSQGPSQIYEHSTSREDKP